MQINSQIMKYKYAQLKIKFVVFVLFFLNVLHCSAYHRFTTEEVKNGTYLFYTSLENLKVGFNEGWICDGNHSSDFYNFSNNIGVNPEDESVTGSYSGTTIKNSGNKKVQFSVSGVRAIDIYVINGNATDNRYVSVNVNGKTYSGTSNIGSWKDSFQFQESDEQTIELTASGDLRLYAVRFYVDNPVYVKPKCKTPLYKIGAYSLYTDLYPILITTFNNDSLWYKINEECAMMIPSDDITRKDSLISEAKIYARKNDIVRAWTSNYGKLNSDTLEIALPEPVLSGTESMNFVTLGTDLDYEAVSYTIPGVFVAGGSNNSLKIRSFRGNPKILVNEGYYVTKLALTLSSTDDNLAFSEILVDGKNVLEGPKRVNDIGTLNIDTLVKDSIVFVFDESIDHSSSQFTISVTANYKLPEPIPLSGDIEFTDLAEAGCVYDGTFHTPKWRFTESRFDDIIEGIDYVAEWKNNKMPGTATLSVIGIGNYKGTIEKTFFIDRLQLSDELYAITMPAGDICYDESEHKASATVKTGVGEVKFTYTLHGEKDVLPNAPVDEGHYDVYCEIADGEIYYGKANECVGSFAIYRFDELEWQSLGGLYAELQQMNVPVSWSMANGVKSVGTFEGLNIEKGHVVGITLANKGMTGLFPSSLVAFTKLEDLDISNNNLSGDISVAIAAARMQNPLAFNSLKTLNISNNHYKGNIGILAGCMSNLTSLNASNNKFEDLFPALSSSVTNLDVSNQKMERVVELNMSDLSLEDMGTKVPSIILYDQANHTYKKSVNLLCTKADLATFSKHDTEEWAMQLKITDGNVSIPYVSAQNAYHGESGDILNVLNMTDDDTTDGCSFRITLSFNQGDANFVSGVDATDLQTTILYAFGGYRNYPFNFTAADTYKDGVINVQDVICTVNILLSSSNDHPQEAKGKQANIARTTESSLTDADAYMYICDGKIYLHSRVPVASLSVKADGNVRWDIERVGLMQSTANGNVVAYSLNGATIPSYEDVVLGECANAKLCSVSLSDIYAQSISVGILDDKTIGIFNTSEKTNEEMKIYDVSGYSRHSLGKGINIIRRNGTTQKIYISK